MYFFFIYAILAPIAIILGTYDILINILTMVIMQKKEYIKHDRPLSEAHIKEYGKLATHDIHLPILILYEMGKIKDKNGTEVNIDKKFINETMRVTNERIKTQHKSPFAKLKSFWSKPVEEVEVIPIIKNHATDNVDGTVGHTKGLLYTEEVDGILSLLVKGVIKDSEAKRKIEGDIFRNTSMGTRADGSIKEISIVINEAAPHGGFVLAEENKSEIANRAEEKTVAELQLAEEINGLQLEEALYEHTLIPNHLILSKLIKQGKLAPYKYDQLINTTNREALQLMECALPSRELGIMFGTNRDLQPLDLSELKTANDKANDKIDEIVNNWKVKNGEEVKKEFPPIEMIKQSPEDNLHARQKELKHILELAEYSPDIAAKYIKCELGEEVEDSMYKDTLLSEYLDKLGNIKTKLKQLQLGE